MGNPARPLIVDSDSRRGLNFQRQCGDQKLALRASIVLGAAEGVSNSQLAKRLGTSRPTVNHWRKRFEEADVYGLTQCERSGRKKRISEELIKAIRDATVLSKPTKGIRWSTRTLARAMGVSHSTVFRLWQAQNLQPQGFAAERVRDIVGLNVKAGESALAFTSANGTNLGTAIKRAHARERYDRVKGRLLRAIGDLASTGRKPRDQRISFLDFLDLVALNTSDREEVHIIAERGSAAKFRMVQAWSANHARCHIHFVPAGAEWHTFVQHWLGELSPDDMRPQSYVNLAALTSYVGRHIAGELEQPIWTAPRYVPRQLYFRFGKSRG